jgi:hypothetical protein
MKSLILNQQNRHQRWRFITVIVLFSNEFLKSMSDLNLLMTEVTHIGEDHRHTVFVGGGDNFIITH